MDTVAYYTLLVDFGDSQWSIEFGSAFRSDVVYEADYYKDDGYKTKIIKTKTDSQNEINRIVDELNG